MELYSHSLTADDLLCFLNSMTVKNLADLSKGNLTFLANQTTTERINVCLLIEAPPCRPDEFEFSLIDLSTNDEIALDDACLAQPNRISCTRIAICGDYLDYENREFWRTVRSQDIVSVVSAMVPFMNQCQLEIDQVDLPRALPIIDFFHKRHYFSDLRIIYYNQPFTPLMKDFVEDQVGPNNLQLQNIALEGDMLPSSFRDNITPLLLKNRIPGISVNATNIVFGFEFFEHILLQWFSLPNACEVDSRTVFAYYDFEPSRLLKYLAVVDPEDELVLGRRFAANGAVVSCKLSGVGKCLTLHLFGCDTEHIDNEDRPLFEETRLTY
uniref:F-box domain-containing protein n=1 Tax=Steinernema glaseri TaxID=37863 RepID=A0A1I7YL49_9BILA